MGSNVRPAQIRESQVEMTVADKLRVCVLQSSYEGSTGELVDLDPYRVPEIHDTAGKYEWTHAYIKKATAVQQVRDLARSKQYDVFLNLCDGAFDEDRAGQEVVNTLDRYGCAYTGANSVFYEPSKELMKKMAHYYDVPTPPWAFIYDVDEQDDVIALRQVADAVAGLKYPLIVKHFNGYSSVGMGKDCKVMDAQQLMLQVRKFVSAYGGALVEEFIPGREFTVLVVENEHDLDQPQALLPVECSFAPGEDFKHFNLKWREYDAIQWTALDVAKEPQLDAKLRKAAATAFVALKGCSYGRADFRVDAQGNIYYLEMNPNCGLFYPKDAMGSADIILTLDPQMQHAQFIDHIIACALARRNNKQSAQLHHTVYKHGIGYGMYASRDIAVGEVVIKYEERPHVLMTKTHAARVFGPECVPGPCPVLSKHSQQQNGVNSQQVNGHSDHIHAGNGHASDANSSSSRQESDGVTRHTSEQQASGEQLTLKQLRGQWFKAYAYPVSDEVWVTWSENPDDWLPLNHSCDPSTWIDGLNLVARRPIMKGEQVTADYATFAVHNAAEFQCHCGAARCRGLVKGTDYLEHWVDELYGKHVSPYITSKRALHRQLEQQGPQ